MFEGRAMALGEAQALVWCWLQGDEEDDDRWVMEQVGKGARSVPSASAISSLNLNGRCSCSALPMQCAL